MNRSDRLALIDQIGSESGFNGPLVVYITGDRGNLETKIATDIFPMFHKHLMEIGKQKCINLFLYSTGGMTIAGYALVNLFREFCEEFNVIVPFKAYSAATLVCLGADNIIMTPIGQLGPIDPSVEHVLGPKVQFQGQPQQQSLPVNVEEVTGFINMAKKKFGLKKEESMKTIFELLTSKIHPLTLGSVQRTIEQIKFLATTLMKNQYEPEKIDLVVKTLTQDRYSHDYIISRKEAEDVLELNIIEPNEEQEKQIMDLFDIYNNILELDNAYNGEIELGAVDSKVSSFNRGIIESLDLTHVFRTTKEIRRIEVPQPPPMVPVMGIQERIVNEGWIEDNQL